MRWQIMKRAPGWKRKRAIRGEQYDGSRWELHKSYDTEAAAKKAFDFLTKRDTYAGGLKGAQYKLVSK